MRYIALIYGNEQTGPKPGDPGFEEMVGGYFAFTNEIREKGVFHAGDPLDGVGAAKTVRVRNGQKMVTNGPFAETAEQVTDHYLAALAARHGFKLATLDAGINHPAVETVR